jgi:trimethylamine---corrinoid protein Co-methyltransferase
MFQDAPRIHEASVALLDNPGIRFEHDGVVDRLLKAGAKPGHGPQDVRIPRGLLDDSLKHAPSSIRLADRRPGGGYTLTPDSPGRVWSTPGMNLWRHGKLTPFTSRDMADAARLLDQLDGVDGVFGLSLGDIPASARDVVGLRVMAANTTKHIRALCFTPAGAEWMCRMKPVLGPDPWFSIGFTAHGPLRWTRLALEVFIRTAGHGLPTTLNGEPMAGVSGPVTLAGSAAVGNAEILAALVVNQLLEPGRPCIYNLGLAHVFDMRTAIAVTGGPENHLFADISAAMGRFYKLPSCSWVSTDSMGPDSQAALEKTAGFLSHLQNGVSLIWGAGQLESELAFSPAQAVIDQEIIAYVRRMIRGVTVTGDTLATDLARSVGISGDFLGTDHTLDHFKEELWEPSLLWRKKRDIWAADGAKTLTERAEDKADRLIAADRPACLTPNQQNELDRLGAEFLKG